jgi:glutamate synthase (NADPH/NADH) large chain
MTGGLAFVYDVDGRSAAHINRQMVNVETLNADDANALQAWLYQHVQFTGSVVAQAILADWPTTSQRFLKIAPKDLPNQAVPMPALVAERVLQ